MTTDVKTQFFNYMTLQRFADHTKRTYVTGVKGLAKFYVQSPDTLTNEQIQDYLLHLLKDRKLTWGTVNAYLSGIICFYRESKHRGQSYTLKVNIGVKATLLTIL